MKRNGILQSEVTEKETIEVEIPVEKLGEDSRIKEDPFAKMLKKSISITKVSEQRMNEIHQEGKTKKFEIKTPMLIYVPDAGELLRTLKLSDSEAKAFIKKAKDAGIHFIFHTSTTELNTFRDGLGKYLKEMTRTGFVGQRSTEQRFVNVKKNHSEPALADGEHTYFNKKVVERVRTIGMSE